MKGEREGARGSGREGGREEREGRREGEGERQGGPGREGKKHETKRDRGKWNGARKN